MNDENVLTHGELTAYVDILDVAEACVQGQPIIAMAMLSQALHRDPLNTMSVLTGFVAATLITLAEVQGCTPSEMAAQLRANGAL